MPIESQKEWKWMAVNRPDLLHKWQKESPVTYKNLPKKVDAKAEYAREKLKMG